mgnify:CR=1 FL=1
MTDLEVRVLNDDRRPGSGVSRSWRAASSAAVAAALALIPLTACSSDSEPSPTTGTTTAPVETTTEDAGQAIENGLYYYPPVEGATLRYQNSGGTGASTLDVTVTSVTSSGDGQTVAVTEVVGSDAGQPVTIERTLQTGADGSLRLNAGTFGAFGPNFEVTAEGDDIVIPSVADLQAGKQSSGSTFVEMSGSGMTMRTDMTYTVTGVGWESVTVPAGTVEAYLVEIQFEGTNSVMGAVTARGRYWFVPEFGLVRQEFSIAMMSGTTELVSSSVPLR